MVVSPEHALINEWLEKGIIKNADEVKAYQLEASRKSDMERTELNKNKTGVRLDGVMGINPVNDTEIPIFISDYVLASYGTGAIMAVRLMIPVTGSLQRNLACRLSKSSRAILRPIWMKQLSPMSQPVRWSTPAS